MKTSRMKKELKNIADSITKHYKPNKIILYGSAATGKLKHGSDLDLMVIKKTNRNPWDRMSDVDRFIEHNIPLDILIYTPGEIRTRIKLNDFFIKDILKKGKVLYEKK